MEAVYNFDYSILNFIQDHLRCGFLDGFFGLITHLGDAGLFWIALACILLIFKRTRKIGLTMGIAMVFGLIAGNLILKPLTARVRPYEHPDYVHLIRVARDALLIKPEKEFSFPSGHTLVSIEGALGIMFHKKSWGIAALVLAVLISFSRLYLYVHYFTDVAASVVLGAGFAVAAYFIGRAIYQKIEARKAGRRA